MLADLWDTPLQSTDGQVNSFFRYYLPLIAIAPMAALAGSSAIMSHRLRGGLLCFLVVAPIVFGLFGAPENSGAISADWDRRWTSPSPPSIYQNICLTIT